MIINLIENLSLKFLNYLFIFLIKNVQQKHSIYAILLLYYYYFLKKFIFFIIKVINI